jgi:hypothetical protein
MRTLQILLLSVFMGLSAPTLAAKDKAHSEKERQEDITRHRAMAQAHTNMAKCLEAKKDVKACQVALAEECKGLGIGKYCGLKHAH